MLNRNVIRRGHDANGIVFVTERNCKKYKDLVSRFMFTQGKVQLFSQTIFSDEKSDSRRGILMDAHAKRSAHYSAGIACSYLEKAK